jgi:HEAT repeats
MSQTDFDQLVTQLSAEDARQRRIAAKRLGELKRPEAIPDLANVYHEDADESVRKAAGEALRVFRRMERNEGLDDDEPRGGGPSGASLLLIRNILVVTLALTVLGNVGLLVSRILPAPGAQRPPQSAPSPRADLTKSLDKRITDARAEARSLREVYTGLQGMGVPWFNFNQAQCEKLQGSKVNAEDLGNLDTVTYPDLRTVNDQINQAVLGLVPLRTTFLILCANKDQGELDRQLNSQGGATAIITKIDSISNKDLANAAASLKKAIDNPAPTVGPTFTPTTPPTSTPAPTDTPGPATPTTSASATTKAGAPTAAGSTQASPATAAPSQAGPSVSFNGLGLETLKTYKYQVAAKTDGSYTNGKTFTGSLRIRAARQVSPLAAQYDVTISDANTRDYNAAPNASASLIKSLAGPLFAPGNTTYAIVKDVFYVLTSTPSLKCQAFRAIGDRANIQDFTFADLAGMSLSAQAPDDNINGVAVKHYHGEKKGGFNNQFTQAVDLYLSADTQLPIRLIETVTLPTAAPKTPSPTGFAEFTLTIQYDLQAQDQGMLIPPPLACQGVPVK